MERKTVSKCLNYVDGIIKNGINVCSVSELEYIHDYMVENNGYNNNIIMY